MGNPIVSIITPSFNRADIIHETAHSIFAQSYPYWEWMIVDDGSTDNSWDQLEQYAKADKRVRIFKRDREPKGACCCRNIAVEKSTGDYVMFLDTDDVLASFCLEQRVAAMQQHQGSDFVIFPMLLFRQKPDDLKLLWNIDKETNDIERILTGDPVCQGTGTLWKKSSFINIGMWDEDLLLWQDIELHLRSLLAGLKFNKRLDLQPDVFIRVSEISLSRTGYHSLPKWKSRLKVLRNTSETIIVQKILDKYRGPLGSMFTDIFLTGVHSGYFNEVLDLLGKEKDWNLLEPGQRSVFKKYILFRKSKLYKIPYLQNIFLNKIKTPGSAISSLSKVPYTKTIQL